MLTWEAAKRLIRGIDLTRYVLRDFLDQINALIFPIIYIMLSKVKVIKISVVVFARDISIP